MRHTNTQVTEKNYNIKFIGRILNNILLVFFLFFFTTNFSQIYVADSAIVTISNGASVVSSGHIISSFTSTKTGKEKNKSHKDLASLKTVSKISVKKKKIKSLKTPQEEALSQNSYYSNQLPVQQFVSSASQTAKGLVNISLQKSFLKPSEGKSVSSSLEIYNISYSLYNIEGKESSLEFSYKIRPPPFYGKFLS